MARIDVQVTAYPRSVINANQNDDVYFTANVDCTLYFHDASLFGQKEVALTQNTPYKLTVKPKNGKAAFVALAPQARSSGTTNPTSSSVKSTPGIMGNPNEIVVP